MVGSEGVCQGLGVPGADQRQIACCGGWLWLRAPFLGLLDRPGGTVLPVEVGPLKLSGRD